ncbi:hypothetical protein NX722_19380 [Endozoicomonas gorgoniicola]|uniref:Uncharacterized protein n=1 Tax=Endozoicomonas gorgoniicola TaxID=1234144 RepID=A0ABT3MZD9_9GAMM|nr:hypothetical protein [Endozoicomonas gorgoniicola]MCW7554739.1 hypothetical protein [Endozoicomonas gorgoniicola]
MLLLLFAHPVIATMEGLNQVDFFGAGNSKGKTLIITFMPDIPIYLISDGNRDHMPAERPRDIEKFLPVTYIPEAAPKPSLFEEIDWATMFAFSSRFANSVQAIPRGSVHNDLQFAAEDPLFGRVSGHTFRFDRYQTLRNSSMRFIRLIFLQQGASTESETHSIYIDLLAAETQTDNPTHLPFVVHGVQFNRNGELFDGFRTDYHIASMMKAREQAQQKRDSDGDQSKKDPEPASKKDPPEGSSPKKRKTGSNKRHWYFGSGGDGGGNVCSMVQFFIAAVLLSIPSGQKVLFHPDKA